MDKSGITIPVTRYVNSSKTILDVDLIYEASAAEFAHWVVPLILGGRERKHKEDIETIKLSLWGRIAPFYVDIEYRWGTLAKLKKDGKLPLSLIKIGTEAHERIIKNDK